GWACLRLSVGRQAVMPLLYLHVSREVGMRLWGPLLLALATGWLLLPAGAQAEDLANTAEDFISILKPAETAAVPGVRTRSLVPSTAAAPEAGSAGSGKIP